MFTTLDIEFSSTTKAKLISCSSTATIDLLKIGTHSVLNSSTAAMRVSTLCSLLMLYDTKKRKYTLHLLQQY